MNTQTIDLQQAAEGLSDTSKEKVLDFINYIRYQERMEDLEDAEDIADAKARRGEPNIPFEEVIAKFEAQNGPLDQD